MEEFHYLCVILLCLPYSLLPSPVLQSYFTLSAACIIFTQSSKTIKQCLHGVYFVCTLCVRLNKILVYGVKVPCNPSYLSVA